MSDEHTSRREARLAEAAADTEDPTLTGTLRLADAALHAPDPPGGSEGAARDRALSAYHESLVTPRPLHADAWSTAPPGLRSLLARLARRFLGG